MRSTFDIVDIGWLCANSSPLKDAISGAIYKSARPLNSKKEDVVINSLSIDGTQLQEGVLNINIHVPNLVITIDGMQDSSQPNLARLKLLTSMAIQAFEDYWAEQGDVNFSVENQLEISEPEINQHYSNIRLHYFSVNV